MAEFLIIVLTCVCVCVCVLLLVFLSLSLSLCVCMCVCVCVCMFRGDPLRGYLTCGHINIVYNICYLSASRRFQ